MEFDTYIKMIWGFWLFCLGVTLTSGIMCLAYRLRIGESWIKGRSHCDNCGHTLSFFDLIPIVGSLCNKGTCKYCGYKYGFDYTIYELLSGSCFACIILMPQFVILCAFLEILIFSRVYTAKS